MTKADLHRLIDGLPEESLDAVATLLQRAADPVLGALDVARPDDEPFTDEERATVEGARAALQRGEGIPWEQVRAELSTD